MYKSEKVHFGGVKTDGSWYTDFTHHKDYDRMERYDTRHKLRENWKKSGILTAGFWSKWLLRLENGQP